MKSKLIKISEDIIDLISNKYGLDYHEICSLYVNNHMALISFHDDKYFNEVKNFTHPQYKITTINNEFIGGNGLFIEERYIASNEDAKIVINTIKELYELLVRYSLSVKMDKLEKSKELHDLIYDSGIPGFRKCDLSTNDINKTKVKLIDQGCTLSAEVFNRLLSLG